MDKFLEMSFEEFVNYCVGILVLSIGKGEFRSGVATVIMMASQRKINSIVG